MKMNRKNYAIALSIMFLVILIVVLLIKNGAIMVLGEEVLAIFAIAGIAIIIVNGARLKDAGISLWVLIPLTIIPILANILWFFPSVNADYEKEDNVDTIIHKSMVSTVVLVSLIIVDIILFAIIRM